MSSTMDKVCLGIGSVCTCILFTTVALEFGYRQYNHFTNWGELDEAPLNQYNVISLRKYTSAAVFLYNTTLPEHHEFLHDVKVANYHHSVDVFQLECTQHKAICGSLGHGQIHEYEEPPVIFYHKGEWSESYHDDVQQGKVPKPTTRKQRVAAIISWLDKAHARGNTRIVERANRIAEMDAMGSPTQRMMEQMRKEAEKKGAGKPKDEKKPGGGVWNDYKWPEQEADSAEARKIEL